MLDHHFFPPSAYRKSSPGERRRTSWEPPAMDGSQAVTLQVDLWNMTQNDESRRKILGPIFCAS